MTGPRHHHALPAGYTLHWYVMESVLGQGGFGITYLARDSNLDQRVAIKEFLPAELATRVGCMTRLTPGRPANPTWETASACRGHKPVRIALTVEV